MAGNFTFEHGSNPPCNIPICWLTISKVSRFSTEVNNGPPLSPAHVPPGDCLMYLKNYEYCKECGILNFWDTPSKYWSSWIFYMKTEKNNIYIKFFLLCKKVKNFINSCFFRAKMDVECTICTLLVMFEYKRSNLAQT